MSSKLEKLIYQYNKYKYKYKTFKQQQQLQMHGGHKDPKSTTDKIILAAILKFHAEFDKVDTSIADDKYKQLFINMENMEDKIGFFNARLPPQSEQHTKLPEGWDTHIIETTECSDGTIYTLDDTIEIKNSSNQIKVEDLLEKLHSGQIEFKFAWSERNKLVFVNFISKNPHDFTNTNYVFRPKKEDVEPYAFYKGECNTPTPSSEIPFYMLLSRQFTTYLTALWLGRGTAEAFKKNYDEYDFSKSLPLRNMSTST